MQCKLDINQIMNSVMLVIFCLWLFNTATGAQAADDSNVTKQQLEALKEEIEELKKILSDAQQKRGEVQQELQKTQQSIGKLNEEIGDIKTKINQQEQQRDAAKDEELLLLQRLADDKLTLAKGIKLAYLKPLTNPIKILLNQERPEQALRMLSYYGYLAKAQTERIQDTTQVLHTLKKAQALVHQETARLVALKQSLTDRSNLLGAEKIKQELLISALALRVTDNSSKLLTLNEQQNALERLLAQLRSQLILKQEEAFIERRGELPWPIAGAVLHRFGEDKLSGKMRYNGVFIQAKAATMVSAVHYGQVVFADRFKGFGQLIIIDHGEGFMSLYANNSRLIHKTGDWVAPGEPVAIVGKSQEDGRITGLYFELRREGQPYDPMPWLRKSG